MKDKKTISVRKLAALERAKALGLEIKRPKISDFERQAREWQQREEMEKRAQSEEAETEALAREGMSFDMAAFKPSQDAGEAAEPNEGFNWDPFQSEQGEGKKKVKDLNAASIARLARKIIAREWAMALGRGMGLENGQATIERGVEEYRKKKAAEREMKEIEGQRANKQRAAMEAALWAFGRNLLKVPKPVAPEEAETLLEEALSKVGDTIRITWQPDGCHILLEPWEEKRLRRKTRSTVPAIFQATIDDNLMLSSYQRVEDPQVLRRTQNDIILKNILSSFRKSPRKDFHAFENAVSEGGRIIRSTKMDGGGKINFEPWEEMRRRNLERKGQHHIMTYMIKGDKDFNHISCERV